MLRAPRFGWLAGATAAILACLPAVPALASAPPAPRRTGFLTAPSIRGRPPSGPRSPSPRNAPPIDKRDRAGARRLLPGERPRAGLDRRRRALGRAPPPSSPG